ncbi:MAG: DUF1588 domain-containing protein [Clostridia bacterium]|nr:DUF1588 domain-containing protein [Deltaproteobacteria bacterium]
MLRRLTELQYANTIRIALGGYVTELSLPQFNDDVVKIGLGNDPNLLRISPRNIDSIYQSTLALAQASLDANDSVRECVAATDDQCFVSLARELGRVLWRRPLTAAEMTDLEARRSNVAQATGTRAEQATFILQALLMSPHTFYRRELGSLVESDLRLDDLELASALSYTLWNEPPDEELYALAEQQALSNSAELTRQAARMSRDPRFLDALTEFYIDYLKLGSLASVPKGPELGLTVSARASLLQSVRVGIRGALAKPGATVLAPFTSDVFHINDAIAGFFGTQRTSDTLVEMKLDTSQRFGVLSHPAFLAVHSSELGSGIVRRGVFTLEQLLCVHLGAPPAELTPSDDVPEGFDPERTTTREVLRIQHSSQAACSGCHRVIDPAGYGYENYDGAGRFRTVEKESLRIDASGALILSDETLSYSDSLDYLRALAASRALQGCVAEHLLTYALGDQADVHEGGFFVRELLAANGDIARLAELIVTSPSFSTRNVSREQ